MHICLFSRGNNYVSLEIQKAVSKFGEHGCLLSGVPLNLIGSTIDLPFQGPYCECHWAKVCSFFKNPW